MFQKPADSFLTQANKKLQGYKLSKPYDPTTKIKRCIRCEYLGHALSIKRYFCTLGGFRTLSVSTCNEIKVKSTPKYIK